MLPILYQDDWIVAIDKPAGALVHPAENPQADDVVAMKVLRDQLGQHVHVIHRLDRPTSGVLLFATDREAAKNLHLAFEKQRVEKVYWAVVDGSPEQDAWECHEPLRREKEAQRRSAETSFRVLQRLPNDLSLIESRPKTGRFHQIRRHLLQAGYPIVGDYRYAGIERSDALGDMLGTGTRMLLQAKQLRVEHPVTKNRLSIEAPIDSALAKALGDDRQSTS